MSVRQGHWRSDTFCEATNIVVDFGKVKGVHFTGAAEPRGGDMFHDYDQGAFSGACQKQGWSVDRFILQHRRMMEAFQPSSQAETADEVVDLPHFFITRDEDAHNFFHGGCDMVRVRGMWGGVSDAGWQVNAFLVKEILDLDVNSLQARSIAPDSVSIASC